MIDKNELKIRMWEFFEKTLKGFLKKRLDFVMLLIIIPSISSNV